MSKIKELAKDLCDKSPCHHKCPDTDKCIVEEEAELLINGNKSNNFDVKSNNELFKQALVEGLNRHFDKTIEEAKKIEEIEEIAEIIHESDINNDTNTIYFPLPMAKCLNKHGAKRTASAIALLDASYRKQSEGEWKDRYNGKYANSIYECSLCKEKALWKIGINELGSPKITQLLSPFCPNCGAKMKGGAE